MVDRHNNSDEPGKSREQLLAEIADLRRQIEALSQSEAALRATIASLDDLVFVLDRNGVFQDFYQPEKAARLYAPPETFLGKSLTNIMPRQVSQRWEEAIKHLETTGEVQQFDYPLVMEGEERWYTAKISIRKDAQGDYIGVTGVIRNISERKQVEEALLQSQKRLTEAQHIAHVGNWVYDMEEGELFWSDELFRIFGREPQPITPDIIAEWVHPDDRPTLREASRAYKIEKAALEAEYRLVHPDGSIRHAHSSGQVVCDPEGKVIGTVGTVQDITERKLAERALEEERRLLNTVLNNLPVQVYVKDTESRFVLINDKTKQGLQVESEDEYIGKTDFDFLDSQDTAQAYLEEERQIIETGVPVLNKEHVGANPQRGLVWVVTSKLPLRDADGNITGILGIGVDITQRKLAERALEEERRLLTTVLDILPSEVYVKDTESRFMLMNKKTKQGFQVESDDEYIGKTDVELLPHAHERAAEYLAEEQALLKTGEPILNKEHTGAYPQRGLVWRVTSKVPLRDADGNITGLVGIGVDITEQKNAVRALEEERNLLNTVLNNLPAQIYVKDIESRFVLANVEAQKGLRVESEDEYVGKTDLDFPHLAQGNGPAYFAEEQAIVKTGEPLLNQERGWHHPELGLQWHVTSKLPLRDADGNMTGLVGIGVDITPRKLAEIALQESEARYRRITELMSDYAFGNKVIEDGSWEVEWITEEAYTRITGYSPEELSRHLVHYHPDDRQRAKHDLDQVIAGEPSQGEYRLITNQGALRWLAIQRQPVWDEAHERVIGFYGAATDITEQKEAEEQLHREHERLERIAHTSPVGIIMVDSAGEITFANRRAEMIYGLTKDELAQGHYNTPDWHITDYDGQPLPDEALPFQQVKRTNQPVFDVRYAIEWPDGRRVYLSINAAPLVGESGDFEGMVAAIEDVSERKQADEALLESEAKLRSIFRVAPTGIGLVVDRVLMQVNDRICEMIGRTQDELIGQSARILYPSDDHYEFVGREKYAQIRDHGTGTVETKWQHKDGSTLDVLLSSTPIDPQDHSVGVTFTALDITARKQAEEHALALSIEKERTHLIAEFIQAASHEFRTPLSTINMSAHVIERTTDSQQHKDRLEQIKNQVQNITRLVNDLVTMARLDSGALEDMGSFDVNGMMANIEVALQNAIQAKGVTLNVETARTDQVKLRGNVEEVYTAITNVVLNGLRFTPEGGTVTLRTDQRNGSCVIEVQDTGIGMNDQQIARIFERFYRVDEARTSSGFGLGLPIAWKIIERHAGQIEVESTPGQGSTFRIILPISEVE